MCRSSGEPGGPRRCPAHARSRLVTSIAAVEELELREAALYRAASVAATVATQHSHHVTQRLHSAKSAVKDLREWAAEDGPNDAIIDEYREAYRDFLNARRAHDAAQEPTQEALSLLAHRRGQAQVALEKIGLTPADATNYLNAIDRKTGFTPPF